MNSTIFCPSIHVHPSDPPQSWTLYDRSKPLPCNVIEYNDIDPSIGYWDTTLYRWVCLQACRMEWYGLLLWMPPPDGGLMTVLIYKNGIEQCGGDNVARQTFSPGQPQGNTVQRQLSLVPGDYIDLRPCQAMGTTWSLTKAIDTQDINTVNYFEGKLLAVF